MPTPRERAQRLRDAARDDPDAVDPGRVLELLRHPEREVQRVAAGAFLPLVTEHPAVGTGAVERMAYLLRSTDPKRAEDPEQAVAFAQTLLLSLARVASVAPEKALSARTPVLDFLDDPSGPLAAPASVCLAQFVEAGPTSFVAHVDRFEALLAADEPSARRNAAHILTQLADSHPSSVVSAVPTLRERLDDPDPETAKKSALVLGLAAREDPSAVAATAPQLSDALDADERGLRANAAGALADIAADKPELVAERTGPLVERLDDDAAAVRRNTAAALSRLAKAGIDLEGPAHGALIELLDDADPTVRATACRALGHMGSAVALELLRKTATEDDEAAVRRAAQRALERR